MRDIFYLHSYLLILFMIMFECNELQNKVVKYPFVFKVNLLISIRYLNVSTNSGRLEPQVDCTRAAAFDCLKLLVWRPLVLTIEDCATTFVGTIG